MYLKLAKFI